MRCGVQVECKKAQPKELMMPQGVTARGNLYRLRALSWLGLQRRRICQFSTVDCRLTFYGHPAPLPLAGVCKNGKYTQLAKQFAGGFVGELLTPRPFLDDILVRCRHIHHRHRIAGVGRRVARHIAELKIAWNKHTFMLSALRHVTGDRKMQRVPIHV